MKIMWEIQNNDALNKIKIPYTSVLNVGINLWRLTAQKQENKITELQEKANEWIPLTEVEQKEFLDICLSDTDKFGGILLETLKAWLLTVWFRAWTVMWHRLKKSIQTP